MTEEPARQGGVVPYLLYADVATSLDWLAQAFGFVERAREPGADGVVTHAEMVVGDGLVMLGNPGADYRNPRAVGHPTQLQFVTVNDIEAHHARAVGAGARIVADLDSRDYGQSYGAEDPEGHQWFFTAGG